MLDTIEVNAAFVDDRSAQLVFVKELIDRLRSVEKRCVELEAKVNGSTWEPDEARRRSNLATRASRAARHSRDSSELEEGSGRLDSVGHGQRAAGVLADGDEEDSLTEQERDPDYPLVHEVAAAVSERALCTAD